MPTVFLQTEKFFKSLPVIKNIPGFSSLPPGLSTENLRFYKLANLVHTLGMFTHLLWTALFLYLEVYPLFYINLLSVGIYIFNIVINRRGHSLRSIIIMVMEVVIHQIIAIRMIGWEGGFQYYILIIGILPFLMPQGKWMPKSLSLLACLVAFLATDLLLKDLSPVYSIPQGFLLFFRISNIAAAFIFMVIGGAYFNIAMHETEAQLVEKTQLLIEAEKKATLGKIATEMAHEIQNPLNFVNNFSEVNSDLLQELNDELKGSALSENAQDLIEDLIQNSEKIKVNGKRVSAIVSKLQEETRYYKSS